MDRLPDDALPGTEIVEQATSENSSNGDAKADQEELNRYDVIDIVARRADFLVLLKNRPKHKPALQSELEVSRSTVYKAIRELEDHSLVERTEEGYRLSTVGQLLFEQYDEFCTDVEQVCQSASLLSMLPPDYSFPMEFLDGVEVVHSEPHAPHHPLHTFQDMVETSAELYGMSPVVLRSFIELFREQHVSHELDAELILSRQVICFIENNYPDELRETVQTGTLTLRETTETIPFGLIVSDTPTLQVGVVLYDDDGILRGLLKNDTNAAYSWAKGVWNSHKNRSETITSKGPDGDDDN